MVEYSEVSSHIGDGEELKPCIKEYQVSGTQYFLDIRNGMVGVDVKLGTTADRTSKNNLLMNLLVPKSFLWYLPTAKQG